MATPGRILTEVERSGIKKRMDEIGMNQSRLATMLTTGQAYVNKVINGKLPCSDTFLARIENELTAAEAAFARFAADFNAREGIGEASAESTAELEIPVVADESLRAQLEIVLSKLDQVNAEHLAALQETDRLRETLKRNNSVVPQHKPAALNLDRVVHRFPDCTIRDVVDWAYLFGVGLSFSLEPIEAE